VYGEEKPTSIIEKKGVAALKVIIYLICCSLLFGLLLFLFGTVNYQLH
jgi:hypothetical protein